MEVEIYESPFITANDARNSINPLPILNDCNKIREELDTLTITKNRLLEAKSYLTREFFYVEGLDMEDRLEMNVENLQKVMEHIEEYVLEMEDALQKAILEKQMEFNEIAKREEQQLMKESGASL